jgi:hypothetical protein
VTSQSVFISYSSRDRKEAFAIKEILEAKNLKVWLDFFDIRVASELSHQLTQKIGDASLFCLLLSPNAVASPWVHKEIETALEVARGGRLRVLPVILRPCAIPDELNDIVGFDATAGLDQEAVRLRLVRAAGGEELVEDRVLLDAANRLLLAEKEIVLRAEAELGGVADKISEMAGKPIRQVSLVIYPETLPEHLNFILELELTIDTLFHGKMSFFVARYREGHTWPPEFGFDAPDNGEFFLTDQARLDVVFRWFNRRVRLTQQIDGTDLKTEPPAFRLEFDGSTFKPQGEMSLPQTFEIPSLDDLEKQGSHFRFIVHDPATQTASYVPIETDIDMELSGQAGEQSLKLFGSRVTREQRIVLGSEFLKKIASPIRRDVILHHYVRRPPKLDRRAEVEKALKTVEFRSDEVRRLAARLRFGEARLARFRTLHRDAYNLYQETAELLQTLVMERQPPLPEDASLMFRACYELVDIWMRQESFKEAAHLGQTLTLVSRTMLAADQTDADHRRMWAGTLLLNADIHAKLGDTRQAMKEVAGHVETFEGLYGELASAERRKALLNSLTGAIRRAKEWDAEEHAPVDRWTATLQAEIGDDTAERVTHVPSAMELPVWLKATNSKDWPTVLIESPVLRYAVRLPETWSHDPEVRGTGREVEHIYRGRETTEWLIVSFMDKANAESNMKNWVEAFINMTGFPVFTGNKATPELREWRYEGRLPALAKKLRTDEAHAYTGTARYTVDGHALLVRLYIVMARRKTFAWKFALSFETACLEGMADAKVNSQDHVRAGATLGSVVLDRQQSEADSTQ